MFLATKVESNHKIGLDIMNQDNMLFNSLKINVGMFVELYSGFMFKLGLNKSIQFSNRCLKITKY
jgi:hypothetical protein